MKILVAVVGCLVWGVSTVLGVQPLVAVHDSEFTRAFLTNAAVFPTPTGGATGFQWWPTNWAYFVMPESAKEALRSDGTAFATVTDSNIVAGSLLDVDGTPKYPIMFSLACEAIRNEEIAQLTNYVKAGGFLFVGSSSFTRNTNGTTRNNFAFANELGVNMVVPGLTNWRAVTNMQKTVSHRITSHIPDGKLTWYMPFSSEDIPFGIAPTNVVNQPDAINSKHLVWRVSASDATVLATNNTGPDLLVKPYGKGFFIYYAPMQPLIGHGGEDSGMHAYVIFRKAIEWAFESSRMPITRMSPWPYPYDAALEIRHDLEAVPGLINQTEVSAQYENSLGLKGDYYLCTGQLRDNYSAPAKAAEIASLRSAVTNFGATIGSHNGGLINPYTAAAPTDYWYWHWGLDEVLDANVSPYGYPNGKMYAFASISNSYVDIHGWLSGITNNARNHWVAPAYNSTREGSKEVLDASNTKTAGEEKLSPFPHWTFSTKTPGKQFAVLTVPISDWYVGTSVSHSIEGGHTVDTVQDLIDFYYGLGALINQYSHSSCAGGAPPADAVWARNDLAKAYVDYAADTNRFPRLWPVNCEIIFDWWTSRKTAQITPTFTTNGLESRATFVITGSTNVQAAVEAWVPRPAFTNIQVFTNGVATIATNGYRVVGQTIRVLARTGITNVEVRYLVVPGASHDLYSFGAAGSLTVTAPGILTNDVAGFGTNMTAQLVAAPTHGTFSLSTNGGFTYLATNGFVGLDSFTYRAADGVSTSGVATVTLAAVSNNGPQYSEDFTRAGYPAQLGPPWTTSNTWVVAGAELRSTNGPTDFGFAYIGANWTNFAVQARLRFPSGPNAPGAALFGRLNPATGARYALWLYPSNTPFGSPNVLRLIKFTDWTTWSGTPMAQADVTSLGFPNVGTNWHTLKLAFDGNQIFVSYDGTQVLSAVDNNFSSVSAYLNGGVGLENYRYPTGYVMSVDDLIVNGLDVGTPNAPTALNDSYQVVAGTTLAALAPGVMLNDLTGSGGGLTAQLFSGPSHHNGAFTLNANGSFNYIPTNGYTGSDSFSYQVADGVSTSSVALASISVLPGTNVVFFDSFLRTNSPVSLASPWLVSNQWSVVGGMLASASNSLAAQNYAFATIATNWTDFSVEAEIRFPDAASGGGGIGGRVNATTGARYSAWIYPDGSLYGATHAIELFKWSNWTNFSSLGFVQLSPMGTGPHTLKLTFQTNRISLFYDGTMILTTNDNSYASGGATVETYEDPTHYSMLVDYFLVSLITDLPVAVNDSYSTFLNTTLSVPSASGVLVNDTSGVGGGTLTAVLATNVAHGTLTLTNNGGFRYVPTGGYTGPDSFAYRANDGLNNSTPAIVTLTVNSVNTAPTLTLASNNVIVLEDSGAVTLANYASTTVGGSDVGQSVTNIAILSVSNPSLFAVAPAISTAGTLTFTPAANSNGVATITAQAQDNGGSGNGGTNGSTAQNFTITLTSVLDPAVASADNYQAAAGAAMTVAAPGVLFNDTSGDGGGSLTAQLAVGPLHNSGTFTLATDGSFTYTPTNGFTGTDSFTYRALDGVSTSAVATVTITVQVSGMFFYDDFSRTNDPAVLLTPWTAVNNWSVTGNELRSASLTPPDYGFAYINTNWTNFALSARVRFPDALSGGGGLAGRLNPATGARYAVWIYPDNSPYGQVNAMRLLKFSTWDTFTQLAQVNLGASVGTNWHAVKLACKDSQIAVYYDGIMIATVNDPSAYTSGGIDVETFENTVNFAMNVDDVLVTRLALDNSYAINEDAVLSMPRAGVLTNDTGVFGTNLTASVLTGPSHGSLTLTNNGGFTYTPVNGYNGFDSFTYQASDDSTVLGAATVNILLGALNDAPTVNVVSNDVIVLEDSGAVTLPNYASFTTGPADESGQVITNVSILSVSNSALFASGPLLSTNGTLTFTPVANANGGAIVTVQAQDNGGTANGGANTSANRTFTINVTPVNDAPSISVVSNDVVVVEDSGAVTLPNYATLSTGPANESSQVITNVAILSVSNSVLFASGPTLSTNGTLAFTPAANANGGAIVTVQAQDNGGTANGGTNGSTQLSFTINVTSVNDAPTISVVSNSVVVLEDSGAVSLPNYATLSAVEAGQSIVNVAVLSVSNSALFASGPLVSTSGTLTFTPVANANGGAIVIVQAQDDGGTANGGTNGSPALSFSINVTSVNDAPTISVVSNSVVVLEDSGAVSLPNYAALSAVEAGQSITNVAILSVSNAPLFLVSPTLSTNGTLSFTPAANANGGAIVTVQAQDDGGTANGGTNGSTALSFSINVTSVNDAPTISVVSNDVVVVEDSGAVTLPNYAALSAIEVGQSITNVAVLSVSNSVLFASGPTLSTNGTLAFTSVANANGGAIITVQAQDDGGTANGGTNGSTTLSFSINVTAVNDAPTISVVSNSVVVLEDSGAVSLPNYAALSAIEIGQSITNVAILSVSNAPLFLVSPTLSTNGTLSFTPAANANGGAIVTVQAQDDGGTANGGTNGSTALSFSINVTSVNDAPTISVVSNDVVVVEDSGAVTLPNYAVLSTGPANESSQAITNVAILSVSNAPLFLVSPTISTSGTLSFTPAANANGGAIVTVQAQDDGGVANGGTNGSTALSFSINVTSVNDAPTISVVSNDVVVVEDSGAVTLPNYAVLSTGPANESSQAITNVAILSVSNATLFASGPTLSTNGTLAFTPVANANGGAIVTVQAQDDGGTANGGTNGSTVLSFTINVTPVNDAPTISVVSNSVTVLEDSGAVSLPNYATLSTGPANESSQVINNVAILSVSNAALFASGPTLSTSGTLAFTPAANANGGAIITVQAQDDGGTANGGTNGSTALSFSINVTPVNDAPTISVVSNNVVVLEDSGAASLPNYATVNAVEAGQTITGITVLNVSNPGLFAVSPAVSTSGTLTFTPTANSNGVATITVQAQDDGGTANGGTNGSTTLNFTITVTAVNDAPTLPAQTNRTIAPLTALVVTNTASDVDLPADTLTYQLTGPTGAAIDTSGIITWTPSNAQGPSTNTFTTVVSDGGLSATNSFVVTVTAPDTQFLITSIDISNAVATVTWNSIAGQVYQLQYKDDLTAASWTDVGSGVLATGSSTSMTNTLGGAAQRYYRVKKLDLLAAVAPEIISITFSNNVATVAWTSVSGYTYRLQYTDNLDSISWVDAGSDVPATDSTTSQTNEVTDIDHRFYRVVVVSS